MMRLRLYIDVMATDADIARLAEYMAAQRLMMVDPGGDEPGFTGRFCGAVPVYGNDEEATHVG